MNHGIHAGELDPDCEAKIERLFERAQIAWREGNALVAEGIFKEILSLDSTNLRAMLCLGVLLGQSNRLDEGIVCLRSLLDTHPDSVEGLNWIGAMLREKREFAEAVKFCVRAVELRPDGDGYTNLGQCYYGDGQFVEAGECFRKVTEIKPVAYAFWNLGLALQMQDRKTDAEWACREGLAQFPNDAQLNGLLGHLLLGGDDPKLAIAHLRVAHAATPDSIPCTLQLSQALMDDYQYDECERLANRVLELDPNEALAYTFLGSVLQYRGQFEEANRLLDKAISLNPELVAPYFDRVLGNKLTEADRPFVERLETLLTREDSHSESLRYLQYAVGKAYNDLGDYGDAMAHFDEANRLSAERQNDAGATFRPEKYRIRFDHKIEVFNKHFFVRHAKPISQSDAPILVVGMMRSGTTLVEQILSSHPEVGGAGELGFWTEHAIEAMDSTGLSLSPTKARGLAEDYLELLHSCAPGSAHVTDKMPHNYLYLGVITTIFPNAKIIHCRRNPADNCLSIYITPFRYSTEYAHDRDNIAFAYRQYRRLMEHWRLTLPPGRMMEVDYEELVADRDSMCRKMVDFCGLQWSDSCLKHEENRRLVATASKWQARQPIYKTSVERWRRYEPWLGPFKDLLDEYAPQRDKAA